MGGLPPELAALLGGGGGAPMPGAPEMGPEMGAPPPVDGAPLEADPAAGESTIDIVTRMIEDAKLIMDTDEDEEDKLGFSKILQMLQKYMADEQRESTDAMQGKMSPRLLAQSYGG